VEELLDLQVSPDGTRLISRSSLDGTMAVRDLNTEKLLWTLRPQTKSCQSTISSNGDRGVSSTWEDTLQLWDFKTGEDPREFPDETIGKILRLQISPNGEKLFSVLRRSIKVWDLKTQECLREIPNKIPIEDEIPRLQISPDGTRLILKAEKTTKL